MIATGILRNNSHWSQSSISTITGSSVGDGGITVGVIDAAMPDATAWDGVIEVTGVVLLGSPNVSFPFKLQAVITFASATYTFINPKVTMLGGDFAGVTLSLAVSPLPSIVLTPAITTEYVGFYGTVVLTIDRS